MDGLTLLNEATARGLSVTLSGETLVMQGPQSCVNLVAEIHLHKGEVVAALRGEPTPDDPPDWSTLAAQRWGTDDAPGIDVPADSWRAEVAGWPPERWSAWRRRSDELTPSEAKLKDIRAAQRQAYDEQSTEGGGPTDER